MCLPVPGLAIAKHRVPICEYVSSAARLGGVGSHFTLAGRDHVVHIVLGEGREADVGDGSRVAVACEGHILPSTFGLHPIEFGDGVKEAVPERRAVSGYRINRRSRQYYEGFNRTPAEVHDF